MTVGSRTQRLHRGSQGVADIGTRVPAEAGKAWMRRQDALTGHEDSDVELSSGPALAETIEPYRSGRSVLSTRSPRHAQTVVRWLRRDSTSLSLSRGVFAVNSDVLTYDFLIELYGAAVGSCDHLVDRDLGGVLPVSDGRLIDVSFDFRSDAGGGDPDKCSPTLRRYHQLLWSKPLPNGDVLNLVKDTTKDGYLVNDSDAGAIRMASDSVAATLGSYVALTPVFAEVPESKREDFEAEQVAFLGAAYSIGGFVIFPKDQIDGQMSINQAKGFRYRRELADRLDLTLECIRRYYIREQSPLSTTLGLYRDFFDLFVDFAGYLKFFYLDQMVDAAGKIKFLLPFDGFEHSPLPQSIHQYRDYRRRSLDFLSERNATIDALGM
jgi:hypothetical protein